MASRSFDNKDEETMKNIWKNNINQALLDALCDCQDKRAQLTIEIELGYYRLQNQKLAGPANLMMKKALYHHEKDVCAQNKLFFSYLSN